MALGRLANKELREAKKQAHFFFDKIWINKHLSRGMAYKELSKSMGVHPDLCHIGMFDIEQCNEVVKFSKQLLCNQI